MSPFDAALAVLTLFPKLGLCCGWRSSCCIACDFGWHSNRPSWQNRSPAPPYLFSYSLKCDKCRSVEYQQVFGGKISRVNFLPVRDAIISARTRNSPRAYIQAWPLECRVDFYNWVQANCLWLDMIDEMNYQSHKETCAVCDGIC